MVVCDFCKDLERSEKDCGAKRKSLGIFAAGVAPEGSFDICTDCSRTMAVFLNNLYVNCRGKHPDNWPQLVGARRLKQLQENQRQEKDEAA